MAEILAVRQRTWPETGDRGLVTFELVEAFPAMQEWIDEPMGTDSFFKRRGKPTVHANIPA